MSDLLSIGSSALQAYSSALNVVSNNIANANTTGYARERANLAELSSAGNNRTQGMGVFVSSIQRITNAYLQSALVSDSASYGSANTFSTYASTIDSWLSNSSTGIGTPLQTFFTDLNSLAQNPTSSAARQAVLTDAQSLSASFSTMQNQFDQLNSQISTSVSGTVTDVNNYAQQIAKLNQQIISASASGTTPNALLDQQQSLLQSLGGDVGISTTNNADGTVNVYIAGGQPLVLGGTANSLSVGSDPYGNNQALVLNGAGNTKTDITSQVSGGSLGGMLDFRSQMLEPAIKQIGSMALALANAVNSQQAAGMDQYGQLGSPLFTTPSPDVAASTANTGSATVAATVADPNQLDTSASYTLAYDGTQWTLTDQTTGAKTALSGNGSAGSPLSGGGMQFVLSGSAAAGDKYLIEPTRYAAGELQLATTDPKKLATASPVQTSASSSNTGFATIGSATVNDATNANLLSSVAIQFTSPTTYSINGSGSYAYTSGGNISYNGWTVQVSGTPAAGDNFTVQANNGSSADNTNALALSNISNLKLLNGSINSLSSANAALVTQMGSIASQASAQLTAATAQQTADQSAQQSVSGVNLDEEAAMLSQLQQAYQAAAQVISTANTLFSSLLQALG